MGAVRHYRNNSLPAPGTMAADELRFVNVGGSYIQYVINNSGVAVPPAVMAHTHVIADVTGLQTALDGKSDSTHIHPNATTSVAGFMSAADKAKLDASFNYVHPDSGVTAGTYRSVTVDVKGHVTAGTNPTTLTEYGITQRFVSLNPNDGYASPVQVTQDLDAIGVTSEGYATTANNRPAGAAANGYFSTNAVDGTSFFQTFANPTVQDAFYYRRRNTSVSYAWLQVASRDWVSANFVSRNSVQVDWNLFSTVGAVAFNTSSTNGPGGAAVYHGLFVPHAGSLSYGTNLAFRNGLFYIKSLEAGVWGSWIKIASESFVTSQGYLTSASLTGYVQSTRQINTGTGLLGGGDLSANRTLTFDTTFGDARYALVSHTHTASQITDFTTAARLVVSATNGIAYDNVTGIISPTYGTAANTIAQGNDSRINNGQTAFSWNNHALAGYLVASYTALDWAGVNSTGTFKINSSATNNPFGGGTVVHGIFIPHSQGTTHGTTLAFRNGFAFWRSVEAGVWGTWQEFASKSYITSLGYATTASLSGYVPTSRTITINGTTFDLSANRSWTISGGVGGSGTAGFVPVWATGSTLGNSSINDSDANYLNISKGFNMKQGASNWSVTLEGSTSNSNLLFYNPAGTGGSYFAGSSTGISVNIIGVGNAANFKSNLNFQVVGQFESAVSTGTAPFSIISTTMNPNLNADMVDGLHASDFVQTSSSSVTNWNTAYSWNNHALAGYLVGAYSTGDWSTVNATTVRVNTSSTNGPAGAAIYHGLWIPHQNGTTYGTSLAFRNGSFYLRSMEAGAWGSWIKQASESFVTSQGYITSSALASYVPTSRTLTINGTSFDLSANRSWTISTGAHALGSHTDVSISSPTTGQILIYSSGTWSNVSPSYATMLDVTSGDGAVQSWVSSNFATISNLTTNYYQKSSVDTIVSGLVSQSIAVNTTMSLTGGGNLGASRTLSLVNDSASPGANKLYGTDGSGNKGWFNQPSSGGVSGSGTSSFIPQWNGTTSLTNSRLEYLGGILIRMNGNFYVSNFLIPRQCTQTERLAMDWVQGGLVYQTDGTEGLYMQKTSGWVLIA